MCRSAALSALALIILGSCALSTLATAGSAIRSRNKRDIRGVCGSGQRGDVRYSVLNAGLEYCDSRHWKVVPGSCGVSASPAKSCLEVQQRGKSLGDGFYFLQTSAGEVYRAFCDMTLEEGGWTLFATKVRPHFVFLVNTFNKQSAAAKDYDAAGCIPTEDWTEVLFRFRHDSGESRVVYTRNVGTASAARQQFERALTCGLSASDVIADVSGFYRHSPYQDGGKRIPSSNVFTITKWHSGHSQRGYLAESFDASGKWVHLWDSNGGNGYDYVDHDSAKGMKCISGSCYLEEPAWLMYR